KSNAENPFSFKKFLHKDTEHESSSRQTYTEDDNIDRGTLPDFCDEHFSTKTEEVDHSYDKRPVSSTTELLDVINNTNSDEDKPFQNSRSRKKKNELPDIFSDLNSLNDLDCASRTELITEVRKLRQTNKELRVDLYDAQKAAMKESKRTRAVTSENIVVKLKQEVKTLKSQLAVITAEKKQLEQCGNTNTLMVQTAHNAAAKLIIGAGTAEQAISLLMSGVESLKLISETLTNIDRFSE
ncbi:endosome-associated-trafficking regulator 1-like, partial [Saccoglossus kowalevskii]